jgi:hypothetical protein
MPPRRSNARPGDVTGRQAEVLAHENAAAIKERQGSLGTITQPNFQDAVSDEVTDLTGPFEAQVRRQREIHAGEDGEVVDVAIPSKIGRMAADLPQWTFGAGNFIDLEEGRRYKFSLPQYTHLDEKGYLWH